MKTEIDSIKIEWAQFAGNQRRYTLQTKINVAKAFLRGNISKLELSVKLGIAQMTIVTWIKDYEAGLYTISNSTSVIRKPKQSDTIKVLQDEVSKAEERLAFAIQAEKLGLTIALTVE